MKVWVPDASAKVSPSCISLGISNKLLPVRPVASIMEFITFLSSPCNFQQGPLTHLTVKHLFMPNLPEPSCVCDFLELQKVDGGGRTAHLEWLHFSLNPSNYRGLHLVGPLCSGPPRQSQQAEGNSIRREVPRHVQAFVGCDFSSVIMISFHKGYSWKNALGIKIQIP